MIEKNLSFSALTIWSISFFSLFLPLPACDRLYPWIFRKYQLIVPSLLHKGSLTVETHVSAWSWCVSFSSKLNICPVLRIFVHHYMPVVHVPRLKKSKSVFSNCLGSFIQTKECCLRLIDPDKSTFAVLKINMIRKVYLKGRHKILFLYQLFFKLASALLLMNKLSVLIRFWGNLSGKGK